LERRIEGRTNTIARTFDRIVALLTEMDYLRGDEVTEDGKRLARLYGELDLLASECLREGVWEGLNPAELAACVSALVYEARQSDDAVAPKVPAGRAKVALAEMVRIWGRLDALEEEFRINQAEGVGQREPDLGFAWAAHQWASDKGLDEVLGEVGMPAGDFVRWCKQVIDVLGQIAAAAPRENSTVSKNARKAVDALLRGVVAYSSVG
jgi:ATP-dependent RNA helicase HelY